VFEKALVSWSFSNFANIVKAWPPGIRGWVE